MQIWVNDNYSMAMVTKKKYSEKYFQRQEFLKQRRQDKINTTAAGTESEIVKWHSDGI